MPADTHANTYTYTTYTNKSTPLQTQRCAFRGTNLVFCQCPHDHWSGEAADASNRVGDSVQRSWKLRTVSPCVSFFHCVCLSVCLSVCLPCLFLFTFETLHLSGFVTAPLPPHSGYLSSYFCYPLWISLFIFLLPSLGISVYICYPLLISQFISLLSSLGISTYISVILYGYLCLYLCYPLLISLFIFLSSSLGVSVYISVILSGYLCLYICYLLWISLFIYLLSSLDISVYISVILSGYLSLYSVILSGYLSLYFCYPLGISVYISVILS